MTESRCSALDKTQNSTHIELKRTICDICAPGRHCGIDAYVKDGEVIRVKGTPEHPSNKGKLCTKGCANRAYIYREDRLKTPLLRVGERGEGKFEEISWERAYDIIAEKLGTIKSDYGAGAVAFYSGYSKWYRPWLQRFAHSFGSQSYGTESSSCFTSRKMAWKTAAGIISAADTKNANLFLGWAFNPQYSRYTLPKAFAKMRENGLKTIVIDPRITVTSQRFADLHIRPRLGTDGALAHAIANILIKNGWIDEAYIARYVHGFEEYREYVAGFNESNLEKLTDVPYRQAVKAAEMLHEAGHFAINESSAPIAHHKNGFQNYRAIMALSAITGNFDRRGGQLPAIESYIDVCAGFETHEHEFFESVRPKNAPLPVGAERFPLWYELEKCMQSMDLPRQIAEGTPYPIKGLFALGLNPRMFPDTDKFLEAIKALDFFVNTDLFMTQGCEYADIVLPACSSFERGEFKIYGGGHAMYTKPVIDPLFESRSDARILSELSARMKLGDELLESGYENCVKFIIRDMPLTTDELRKSEFPVKIPDIPQYVPGTFLEKGLKTPTGKYELRSELIAAHPEWGLDPLPTYTQPYGDEKADIYPFALCTGARLPHALHSRLHDVPWLRSLRPDPSADISVEDAQRLGIRKGNDIEIFTDTGCITVKANPTAVIPEGSVFFYHGYREANAEQLLSADDLDPYSGFPAYRSVRCGIRRKV